MDWQRKFCIKWSSLFIKQAKVKKDFRGVFLKQNCNEITKTWEKQKRGRLNVFTHFGSPLQPQLENVVVATALNYFISSIKLDIIQFVLHEEIIGSHLVTTHEQALNIEEQSWRKNRNLFKKHTSSLKWIVEHCKRAPISLCGFHVTDCALEKKYIFFKTKLSGTPSLKLFGDGTFFQSIISGHFMLIDASLIHLLFYCP